MLQCCAVFVGVFKDNDKEGFENYTLFNACYSAVFAGVFKDNDKEGFENFTLFNACYSAALCL